MSTPAHGVKYEIGIDVGGTFTDWVLATRGGVPVRTGKLLTTSDVATGFLAALDAACQDVEPADVVGVRHGTTIATNALLEGSTAPVVLFTTRGFRDVLGIGRQFRRDLYSLDLERLPPLVPRDRRVENVERVDADGRVLVALEEDQVRREAVAWAERGHRDFAIGYLNSHLNPAHEQRAAELVRAEVPDARVSVSSDVWRQHREFERISTCVVNAAVAPVVSAYLETVQAGLLELGIHAPLLVMTSTGGLMPAEWVQLRPVQVIESGPAAGAIAAAAVGASAGADDVIAFDMGGTTAKVALIEKGHLHLVQEYAVGGLEHMGSSVDGYAISVPVVDLIEVGAGGGSIASVDSAGRLEVGPRSAGSWPGPACYGQGGSEPTVTDANLVLGRFSEGSTFGDLQIDESAAAKSIESSVAAPLGLGLKDAARAIVQVANSRMHAALRQATIERGRDARSQLLVATGGSGPLHAADLAEGLGIPGVVVPRHAGVASAVGLLRAPIRWDVQRPVFLRVDEGNPGVEMGLQYEDLSEEAKRRLQDFGASREQTRVFHSAEARYVGQSYEVEVPVDADDDDLAGQIEAAFHREHERLYMHSAPGRAVEIVNLRVAAASSDLPPDEARGEQPVAAAWPADPAEQIEGRIAGPATLHPGDSSIWIPAGWSADREGTGQLLLEPSGESRQQPAATELDAGTREVVQYGLQSVAEQMSAVVERTAHSTIIREILDYATALFDADGLLIGQSSRLPFDHNSMSTTLATIAERWKPLDEWNPGDIVLTNDPYLAGSQHLPDLQVFMALFHEGKRVGFAGCVGHHVDVGGSVPGSYSLDSREIFEEGLRLPPVLLYAGGEPVADTWNVLCANVRLPATVRGDLEAQVAALRIAEQGLSELIERVGPERVREAQASLLAYAEARMKQEILALPNGRFSFEDALDDDGASSDPVPIKVELTLTDDEILVDFTGTSPQRPSHVNATYAMLLSSVYYVVMALVDSSIPQNDGCFRNVRVIAPDRSVVNAEAPVPIVGRIATCHRVVDTLFGALAKAVPAKIPAAFYGMSNTVSMTGVDAATGERWILFEIGVGGWGARPGSDGLDAFSAHLHNVRNTPIEVVERSFPLRVEHYGLVPDSGGAGKFRGGLGTRREFRFLGEEGQLTVQGDRFRMSPYGLRGGLPGRVGSFTIVRSSGEVEQLPSKVAGVPLGHGDLVRIETQGGGGYGDPRQRSRAHLDRDLAEGKLTLEQAASLYGLTAAGARDAVELTSSLAFDRPREA